MKLTDDVVSSFQVAKIFTESTDRVNSIDFTADGEYFISCSTSDQINIYNCNKRAHLATLNSKKYGVDLIRFTHSSNAVIHSSTKINDSIRYLSLHDNKYLRYFPGHIKKVVSLAVSPLNDIILSASLDKTLRLWDLRTPNCIGLLHSPSRTIGAFDTEGIIFAAGINSETLKLYDLRLYEKGPFITFQYEQERECDWISVKFSRDEKTILISTNGSNIRLVDAFYGTPLQTFTGYENNKCLPIEASFSPDSKYIFSGSINGLLHVWNGDTGFKVCELKGFHHGPVQYVGFNPKFLMLASSCTNDVFWEPRNDVVK